MPANVNDESYRLGAAGSAIRELFAYGQRRKAEIGADKVFDFSIGNPSVPAPDQVRQAIIAALDEPSLELHGYTPAAGDPAVRQTIAASLNRRWGTSYDAGNLYLTMGAAAAIDACLNAVCEPGDEVIVVAPFFPEYRVWIEHAGCTCVVSMATPQMMPDVADIAAKVTERTRAVIIDSPNNPTGAVYPESVLRELAGALSAASKRVGHTVYLISDEPYREIVYAGVEVPWVPSIYDATLVCYSYSKSLSLPGERIGWVLVPDTMPQARDVYAAVCGAGRALGYVCAPSIIQKVVGACVDVPSDVAAYAENREALYGGLTKLGYDCVVPQGAFYLWVKALEDDAKAFSERAKAHELLIVPSDDFGMGGYVRISYCVSHETIVNSLPAFAALMEEYRG